MKVFDRTGIAFVFFLMVVMIFHEMKTSKNLELELSDLRSDKIELDSLYQWKSERLKIYLEISLEQSKTIDKFRSSREDAKNNIKLTELKTKLY